LLRVNAPAIAARVRASRHHVCAKADDRTPDCKTYVISEIFSHHSPPKLSRKTHPIPNNRVDNNFNPTAAALLAGSLQKRGRYS
jgi:hypothetical protein